MASLPKSKMCCRGPPILQDELSARNVKIKKFMNNEVIVISSEDETIIIIVVMMMMLVMKK